MSSKNNSDFGWGNFCSHICSKMRSFFSSVNMTLYWFFIIILFGGASTWFTLYYADGKYFDNYSLCISLSAYSITLIAVSGADFILDVINKNAATVKKYTFAYFCLSMIVVIVCIYGLVISQPPMNEILALPFSIAGAVFSVFLWIILSSESDKFSEGNDHLLGDDKKIQANPRSKQYDLGDEQ